MAKMHEVFVSYASADQVAANRLVSALEKRGLSCWIASREIPAGDNFQVKIPAAIQAASVVILLYSRQVLKSSEVPRELAFVGQFKKCLIPLRLENVEPVDPFRWYFTTSQYIDVWEDFEGQVDRLCKQLDEQCGMAGKVAHKTRIAARWRSARMWSFRAGLVAAACCGAALSWKLAPALHGLEAKAGTTDAAGLAQAQSQTDSPRTLPIQPSMAVVPAYPSAEPVRSGIEESARRFALNYYAMASAQPGASLAYLDGVVADPIRFYGQSVSKARLIATQRAYLARWPDRRITVRPDSWTIACQPRGQLCDIRGIYDYELRSPQRQAGSMGAERFSMQLAGAASELTSISSAPIERHAFLPGSIVSAAQHASLQTAPPAE